MTPDDPYLDVDHEGLALLMDEDFVRQGDMVFRESRADAEKIEELLARYGPEDVQRSLNHTHLLLYTGDVVAQEEWGERIAERWRVRLEEKFSDLDTTVEVQGQGGDVMLTFFARPA